MFYEHVPGTSGLRKPVQKFMQAHYAENLIQALFNVLPKDDLVGSTLDVGGDGRHFMDEVVKIIIKMAVANKVNKPFSTLKGKPLTNNVSFDASSILFFPSP